MQSQSKKVWFITGTSSGFGAALALEAIAAGDRVVCAQRDPAKPPSGIAEAGDRALVLRCDVTKPEEVRTAVETALERFGGIDVLVNNAGFGMAGALEELTLDEFRHVFETNYFGLITVTKALVPHFRERRSGRILNISSIGGFTGFVGSGAYCSTKFAVEGLSESIALELAPFGIHVTLVEPGAFRTDFAGRSISRAKESNPAYDETVGKRLRDMADYDGKQPGDPHAAARAMIAVARAEQPPQHLFLGEDAWTRAHEKIERVQRDLAAWESTTRAMDFAPARG